MNRYQGRHVDGVTEYVKGADYDALAARLEEAERLLQEAPMGQGSRDWWRRVDAFLDGRTADEPKPVVADQLLETLRAVGSGVWPESIGTLASIDKLATEAADEIERLERELIDAKQAKGERNEKR